MKSSSRTPSATSLPRAPRDEIDARSVRYLAMMGVRTVCFILMVVVTPYGWYTWVFGLAAVFLPYLAVVGANVGQESRRNRREDPGYALDAAPATPAPPAAGAPVILVHETPAPGAPRRVPADGTEPAATDIPAAAAGDSPRAEEAPDAPRADGDAPA